MADCRPDFHFVHCTIQVQESNMALINLFLAARSALARHRERRRAYDELMALDDRALADIGIHRSQIPSLLEGGQTRAQPATEPNQIVAAAFGNARFATGGPWLPPL
jgi:uncharacterized protein YjiS (DUF1127 family)